MALEKPVPRPPRYSDATRHRAAVRLYTQRQDLFSLLEHWVHELTRDPPPGQEIDLDALEDRLDAFRAELATLGSTWGTVQALQGLVRLVRERDAACPLLAEP